MKDYICIVALFKGEEWADVSFLGFQSANVQFITEVRSTLFRFSR